MLPVLKRAGAQQEQRSDAGAATVARSARSRWWPALAVALLGSAPGAASALPMVDLVFVATSGTGSVGGASLVAAPGDLVTLELRITAGPDGVSSYGISVEFDLDLGDELDFVTATERTPAGFALSFTPGAVALVQESTRSRAGRILTFEAETLGLGPASQTFAIGTIELRVGPGVSSDGPDLRVGLFHPGVDGLFDNEGLDLAATAGFGVASVDAVPETGTALLLTTGLILLSRAMRFKHCGRSRGRSRPRRRGSRRGRGATP